MPDEQAGTPQATPEAPVEPTQAQPTPPTPQKLEGKTPEELMSILQDRDKVIGRQGQELGQLREAVERLYAERSQPREGRSPEREEPRPRFDYENPDKSVEEIVETRLAREREAIKRDRMADLAVRTTAAFEDGQVAMKQNPHLFEGIENDVRQAIVQFYGPAFKEGRDVSYYLRDPNTWEMAAKAVRVFRGELDKIKPAARKGMTAEPTDLPSQSRPTQDDDGIIIEEEDRKEYESLYGKKGTDKEIRELLKLGMTTQRRR